MNDFVNMLIDKVVKPRPCQSRGMEGCHTPTFAEAVSSQLACWYFLVCL